MKTWMEEALLEAEKAKEEGEIPVGAIVSRDGEILGRGHNHREARSDISSHAEIEAMKDAAKKLGKWSLEGCTLTVTLEPCLMCAGAILQSRLSVLEYGADDSAEGALSKYHLLSRGELLVYRGEQKEASQKLLDDFFSSLRGKKGL